MTHSNAFTQYMADSYESDELLEIARHGCESGCAGGMIYYSETIALFDKYRDELFEIMANYADECSTDALPAYVIKHSDTFATFANAVVWFCAEVIAFELANQEA